MNAAIAFGLGVIVGALAAWRGGRRYESAAAASMVAAGYVSIARERWKRAVGSILVAAVVVVLGGAIILMSS